MVKWRLALVMHILSKGIDDDHAIWQKDQRCNSTDWTKAEEECSLASGLNQEIEMPMTEPEPCIPCLQKQALGERIARPFYSWGSNDW